jgi:hypothetical protein
MAMLFLNSVFERTWGSRVGQHPSTDYWLGVIRSVKKSHPDFLFVAEAYWDLEWELQQQGFDFCYDKRLYDRLEHDNTESVRLHLCADLDFQQRLLRFLENHDEPRAAAVFSPEKERAAAVVTATLPGARLFHEGQFEGRKVRLPVFLRRRPEEAVDESLQAFYDKLLKSINRPVFHDGKWSLCTLTGWPDNQSFQDILAWTWQDKVDRYIITVNLSDRPAQARVLVGWPDSGGSSWILSDPLSGECYEREGAEMMSLGLYVELAPWGYHFFHCRRAGASDSHRTEKAFAAGKEIG